MRTTGTPTGKFGAESVRAAQRRVRGSAANFVPRGILGTAKLSRCLRQKQAKRSRGKHSDRILWMKQGAVFGAALRFSQAGTAPRRENRPSARGTRSVFCKGAATPAAKAGNRNQRNFCRAYARRNGFPLKRVVFDTLKKAPQGKPCGAFALLVLQQLFRDCREMADYSTSCRAA